MEREDKDNEMNNRRRQFLAVLLCAAIFSSTACSTTTQRIGASQAAMNHHGLASGDVVLVRYANKNDARSNSRSEQIRITSINESGISGIGEKGEVVDATYDEIFQIEYKKVGSINSDNPTLMGAAKVVEVTSKVLFVAACIAAATGGAACQ